MLGRTNPLAFLRSALRIPLIGLLVATLTPAIEAAIPTSERNALIDFYTSTNGAAWTNKTNWNGAIGTECTWYGVTCGFGQTTVTNLGLNSNNLNGPLPASIQNLTNLSTLDLFGNQLNGSIPPELGNLASLYRLMLGSNQFTGSIPAQLGNLSSSGFYYLYLYSNQLTGGLPSTLQNLSALRYLWVSGNNLTGNIPVWLGSMTSLQSISLADNGFTGSIPSELGNLVNLSDELSISFNQLTGTIPASLGNLTNLKYLFLYGNQLTGSIPPQLAGMTSLQYMELYGNQLSGSIPPELGNMPSLQTLHLMDNRLSGDIPASLGNLSTLTRLYLQRNDLSGQIPSEIGNLTGLVELWLSGNKLTGAVPNALAAITGVTSLNLSYNALFASGAAKTWADAKQPGWSSTQTVAPSNIAVPSTTETTATLTWTPITYSTDSGRYEVLANSGGGPILAGSTASKTATGITLTGLLPGTLYTFTVRTVTDPIGFQNHNTVVSDPSSGVLASTQSQPGISIADSSVTEGDTGNTMTSFTVTLSKTSGQTVSVNWTTANGSATSGVDFVAASGTVTFNSGETSKTIDVQVIGDTVDEDDETFIVNLSSPVNAFLADGQAIGLILDDDITSEPARIILESTPSAMFAPEGATASTTFVISNGGGSTTTVQLMRDSGFFTVSPFQVTLEAGSRTSVTVQSKQQPVGAYSGLVILSGDGVPAGLTAPVTLIVYGPPGADVPNVVPVRIRIDVSGPGRLLDGSVRFRNNGNATALGVVVAESAWLIADRTPVEIPPGGEKEVSFVVNRDFRADPTSTDSVVTTVHFVYPPAPSSKGRIVSTSSGSQPGAEVSDSPPLGAVVAGLPDLEFNQIGMTLPSIRSTSAEATRMLTDVVVATTFTDRSLGLYLVKAGAPASTAARANPQVVTPQVPLQLADIVAGGFQRPSTTGSLHLRSKVSANVSVEALIQAIDDPRGLLAWRDLPTARSDQGAGTGSALYLPGVNTAATGAMTLWVQEVAGRPSTYVVDVLDANGVVIGSLPARELGRFELARNDLALSGNAATIAIRNTAGAGRISAVCEEGGNQLDARSVWDAASAFGATRTEDLVIPWASSGGRSTSCPSNALCVLGNRFHLTLDARDQRTGTAAHGVPIPRNDLFGYFTLPGLTGNTEIPEVFVKMLDGRAYSGNFWTFFGGLTDLEYTLNVLDSTTGESKTYHKEPGKSQGGFDTGSGVKTETCPPTYPYPVSGQPPSTVPNAQLFLNGGRFRVELIAEDPRTAAIGQGYAIPQNDVFGYFSIPGLTHNPDNPEVFVKVLDGTPVNGHFWVFFGSLTDFGLRLLVTDTATGLQRLYIRSGESACGGFDTESFPSSAQKSERPSVTAGQSENGTNEATTLAIYSPTGAQVSLELHTASRTSTATIDLAAGQTRVFGDVFTELFSSSSPESGSIFIRPQSGEISAAAWLTGGARANEPVVVTLPIVPARRAVGLNVEKRFHGVDDASEASIASAVATAVTPMVAIAETAGSSVTVKLGVTYAVAGNLQVPIKTRPFEIGPGGFLLVKDIVRDLLGAHRADAGDIYDATVSVQVVSGSGRVIPVLVGRAHSSGDSIVRVH